MVIILNISGLLLGQDRELLQREDVNKVMNEMFEQHVDQKTMTDAVLKNSFKNYFDQFDPERVYLLDSEVAPAIKNDDQKIHQLLKEYDKGNLAAYEELNGIIQKAILRARDIRKNLLNNKDLLFQSSSITNVDTEDLLEDKKIPYASNLDELKNRIKNQIIRYISVERKRFGDRPVLENENKTLEAFENYVRHVEDQYLYVDDSGKPLSSTEKENLFVLHVLKALARSLDSHTTFLDPNEAYDMQIRLEKGFQGIGVILELKPQGIVVSRLIKDSPAEKSGKIKIDDIVTSIDGQNVESSSLAEAVQLLREKRDTVDLRLKRGDTSIAVALKKEQIDVDEDRVDTTSMKYGNGIIGVLTLHSFYQGDKGITSEKDLRKAMKELTTQGQLKGLILDLRENSGGFLSQAVKVAGLFITNGVVVVSKYSNGEKRIYRDVVGFKTYSGPLIVLTSKATASAAEIVAQALQDYGVALVVGDEHTYGKGTIQSQTVTDHSTTPYFKVTIGKYYTVSGKTPQKSGVKADIVVPSHYIHEEIGEEYLDNALASDRIASLYDDKLQDIDPNLKGWYLHYYMPTLQKKQLSWINMLPMLKKNSQQRLTTSFLSLSSKQKDPSDKPPDPQLSEAINILKDMITLDKQPETQKATVSNQ